MIKLKNINKKYSRIVNRKKIKYKALDNVTLDLADRGLVFVVGENGGDISAFLDIISGAEKPGSGDIEAFGMTFGCPDYDGLDEYREKYTATIYRSVHLFENMPLGRNMSLAADACGETGGRSRIDEVLKSVGLTDGDGNTLYDLKVSRLTDGQKIRAQAAIALIKNPYVIVTDGPADGLDTASAADIYSLLKEISRDRLVVIGTGDDAGADSFADRIIRLENGAVTYDSGNTRDVSSGNEDAPSGGCPECADAASNPGHCRGRGLSWGSCFMIGAEGLRHCGVRLAVTLILVIISVAVFGFSVCAVTTDINRTELKQAYANDEKTAVAEGYSYVTGKWYPSGTYGYSNKTYLKELQSEQIDTLGEYMPLMKILDGFTLTKYFASYYDADGEVPDEAYYSPYDYLCRGRVTALVELDPATGEDDAYLAPCTEESRLPSSFDEIALTDYTAELFVKYGYTDADGEKTEDETAYDISSPGELIGKKINGQTVVGIFSTEEDLDAFREEYGAREKEDHDYSKYSVPGRNITRDDIMAGEYGREFQYWANGRHIMTYAFVMTGYGANYAQLNGRSIDTGTYLYRLQGSISEDRKVIGAMTYGNRISKTYENGYRDSYRYRYSVRISGAYTYAVDQYEDYLISEIIFPVFNACVLLALISFVTAMWYFMGSIKRRRKELGSLRSLGAKKSDIAKICWCEGLYVAVIEFVLSLCVLGIACAIFNSFIYVPYLYIGILPCVTVFALCFGLTALETLWAAGRVSKNGSADTLNLRTG